MSGPARAAVAERDAGYVPRELLSPDNHRAGSMLRLIAR
jgi:hypothetical protein